MILKETGIIWEETSKICLNLKETIMKIIFKDEVMLVVLKLMIILNENNKINLHPKCNNMKKAFGLLSLVTNKATKWIKEV